jgi:hypothetical protein
MGIAYRYPHFSVEKNEESVFLVQKGTPTPSFSP